MVSGELLTQKHSPDSLSCDTSQCLSFKDCFRFSLPQNFLVNSVQEEAGDIALSDSQLGDSSSYHDVYLALYQLLERHYGHVPVDLIFGNRTAGSDNEGLLLIHFEELEECTEFEDFESFLSRHFQPHKDIAPCEAQELLMQSVLF